MISRFTGCASKKSKNKNRVKIKITIDGDDYFGQGDSNTDVQSTFIELQDENLPFEKSAFSSALKKGIQEALSDF